MLSRVLVTFAYTVKMPTGIQFYYTITYVTRPEENSLAMSGNKTNLVKGFFNYIKFYNIYKSVFEKIRMVVRKIKHV